MIEGKTKNGFAFSIDEKRMQDIRVVDAIATLDEESDDIKRLHALSTLRQVMLGKDSERLLDFIHSLHGEDDLIPASEVMETLTEIIKIIAEKSKEIKNS